MAKKNNKDVKEKYYSQLSDMLELSHSCAIQLDALLSTCERCHERVERIDETESHADHLLHSFAKDLTAESIKPKKKEKLIRLSHIIDDLTDSIEAAANIVEMLNITSVIPGCLEMCDLVVRSTQMLVSASREFPVLSEKLLSYVVAINRLEEEGDRIFHSEMKALFSAENPDVLQLIRFKELYEALEDILDCCEDIADKFEAMALKLV